MKFQISDRGRSKSTTQLTLRVAVTLAVSKEKLGQEHQSVLEGAGTLRLVQFVKEHGANNTRDSGFNMGHSLKSWTQ